MKKETKYCNILGTNINVTNMQKTVDVLCSDLEKLKGNYICVSNVHTTVMAFQEPEYRKIQNQAAMALPDGKPLSLVSRMRGFQEAERVAGPDLMVQMLKISQEKGYSHYFYGGTEETLKKLEMNLKSQFPKLKIAGMYSPPFRPLTEAEDEEVIRKMNECRPDFIWVGLGAPKQERWMYEHRGKVCGVMLGVGAAFDFQAGTIKRAPKWMQKMCLEWLFRLTQDPKRLIKRYLVTNFIFIKEVIKEKKK